MQRADSLEKTLMLGKSDGRKRRGRQKDKMVGWHHRLNGHEFEQTLEDSEQQRSLAGRSPWGRKRVGHSNRTITTPAKMQLALCSLSWVHSVCQQAHCFLWGSSTCSLRNTGVTFCWKREETQGGWSQIAFQMFVTCERKLHLPHVRCTHHQMRWGPKLRTRRALPTGAHSPQRLQSCGVRGQKPRQVLPWTTGINYFRQIRRLGRPSGDTQETDLSVINR